MNKQIDMAVKSPLDYAADALELIHGDCYRVQELLSQEPSMVHLSFDNLPVLFFVYEHNVTNRIDVIKELTIHGANINQKDFRGNTLLHVVVGDTTYHPGARRNQSTLVQLLVDKGADVSIQDASGRTPLELACQEHTARHLIPRILRYCLTFYSGVSSCGISSDTPLFFFTAFFNASDDPSDRARLEEFLQADRSLANARFCGVPILHFAFELHMEEILEVLLNFGADPNGRDDSGRTVLDVFFYSEVYYKEYYSENCRHGEMIPLIKLLLHHGAILHDQGVGRRDNPLHRAVIFNEPMLVQLLIDHQVDLNAVNRDGETPLYLASENMLNLWGFRWNLNVIVPLLLEGGANVNGTDLKRGTLLHKAIDPRKVALVQLLLKHDANVNLTDSFGDTPIHLAAVLRDRDSASLELLLEHEPNIDARNQDGETPLHVACFYSRVRAIDLLLRNGANVSAINKYGNTPLHNAVASRACFAGTAQRLASVTLLLEHGADVTCENVGGMTALAFAREQGDLNIIYALIRLSPHHLRPQPGMWIDEGPVNSKQFVAYAECQNTKKYIGSRCLRRLDHGRLLDGP